MSDGKTHFADDDTLDYIRDLEKQLAEAQKEIEHLDHGWTEAIEVSNGFFIQTCDMQAEIERLRQQLGHFMDITREEQK